MAQAELRVVSGKNAGRSIELPVGKFLVGREEDCHLRPNSDLVSRHHCVFVLDDNGLRLRDLGSTNGSFVNGERLQGSVILKPRDRVSIGKLDFEVVIGDAVGEDTETNLAATANTEIINQPAEAGEASDGERDDSALLDDMMGSLDDVTESGEASSSDTLINIPTNPPPEFQGQPAPQTGDTQYFQPGMMPQMPQGYPQMPYPQQMMPYGYPQYPQMGYPVAYPPGYPQQYPQQQPQYQPEEQQPAEEDSGSELAVRLPDPTQTGVKPPEPKPEAPAGGEQKTAEAKAKEEAPSAAAEAIQQYLQRRPGAKK